MLDQIIPKHAWQGRAHQMTRLQPPSSQVCGICWHLIASDHCLILPEQKVLDIHPHLPSDTILSVSQCSISPWQLHIQQGWLHALAEATPQVEQTSEFAAVLHTVTQYLALSLGAPPTDFTTDTSFMEAGLDSLDLLKACLSCPSFAAAFNIVNFYACKLHKLPVAPQPQCSLPSFSHLMIAHELVPLTDRSAQVASLLSSELGIALPSTVAFDYPTVDAITRFVLDLPLQVCCHVASQTPQLLRNCLLP